MSEIITLEKEVYEAVLRNSLRVCDLEKENEDLISRKNWCNARAKKILEKNKQLKQLLKECREALGFAQGFYCYCKIKNYPCVNTNNFKDDESKIETCLTKINEVLK